MQVDSLPKGDCHTRRAVAYPHSTSRNRLDAAPVYDQQNLRSHESAHRPFLALTSWFAHNGGDGPGPESWLLIFEVCELLLDTFSAPHHVL